MKQEDTVSQIASLVQGEIENCYPYNHRHKTREIPKSFSLPKIFTNGLSYNQFLAILVILTDLIFPCMSIQDDTIAIDQKKLKNSYTDIQQQYIEARVLANLPEFLSAFEDKKDLRKILVGALLAKRKTSDFNDSKFVLSLIF